MANFTKKQLDEMDDYQSLRNERLSKKEQARIDQEAAMELAALKSMQESLSREVASYMAKEEIGVVTLTQRLRTSSRQTNRLLKAEANVTLATVASLAQMMGKKPRIVFD